MTTELRLQEMENVLEEMRNIQDENSKKLDEVLGYLKGNLGTDGLVKEFSELKKEVQTLKDRSSSDRTKSDIYIGIIKWLAGIIAALVIAYMFNQVYTSNTKKTSFENYKNNNYERRS